MAAILAAAAALALAAGAAALLRRWLVFVTSVESWSMWPSLRPGQWVLTLVVRRTDRIARGDVVVVDSAELGRTIIKRVVGLGGDRVVIDARGGLHRNHRRVDEPYALPATGAIRSFTVPDGNLLLLGDNRARSSDSRSWVAPYLPVAAVRGRLPRAKTSNSAFFSPTAMNAQTEPVSGDCAGRSPPRRKTLPP